MSAAQRLTQGGFMRTLAAAMQRLGMRPGLSGEESAAANRAWSAGERPGTFARAMKRARLGATRPQRPMMPARRMMPPPGFVRRWR